ncbi:hypothetical protein [Variovorax guangxiensis]|uniref:Uncharacterized protein n=1 Tax=Variovorax guangxiensis TaxID=1775474 RepID=A0A840FLG4_9BURK|nr:hypothetical protein [Variovorax guangxiensis]MBB4220975.1 hypothetical protein [Variovorax guangxiensis]
MTIKFPPDFLETLRQPVRVEADLDSQSSFFSRKEIRDFYLSVIESPEKNDVLQLAADELPRLHPHRATLLALFCGALVEDGADPRLLFGAALELMAGLLVSLEPFCATQPQGDGEEADPEEVAEWQAAEAALGALSAPERFEVEARQAAAGLLVLPLMAMLMRDVRNHRALLADGELVARIDALAVNDSLPIDGLHFLQRAAELAYEDELVVVLPASGTGMVVKAHAINNNFHAFSLLQKLMRKRAKALGIQPPAREAGATASRDTDCAEYLWLQADAFRNGELVDPMAWSWGEGSLRENARRQGRLVLVALDTQDKPSRSWNGFNRVLHSEQKSRVSLVRMLTPEEVASYLA